MDSGHQSGTADLRPVLCEFKSLLTHCSTEVQMQKFFSENPCVLSRSLPLRLEPQDIIALGRPFRSEPDFIFRSGAHVQIPTYGIIELKRPDSEIVQFPRRGVPKLSGDASTAIAQLEAYLDHPHVVSLFPKQDSDMILGSRPNLIVIIGMSSEVSAKLGTKRLRSLIEEELPANLRLIPYDWLLRSFESWLNFREATLDPAETHDSPDQRGI